MSTSILKVDSSILGSNSVSRDLSQLLVAGLQHTLPGSRVVERDLVADHIPHFDGDTLASVGQGSAKLANALIAEVQVADIIVIAAPMYNFGIPSQLKAWFDHIARAKVTFEYTADGPRGLLTNKKVYVVASRGGKYLGSEADVHTPHLNIMLNFLGLDNVSFIYAEGLNMGGDVRENSVQQAKQSITQLIDKLNQEEAVS